MPSNMYQRKKKFQIIVLALFVCAAAKIGILSRLWSVIPQEGVAVDVPQEGVAVDVTQQGVVVDDGTRGFITTTQRKRKSEIRFATFGTSFAWGSLLKNREEEAFTWLLSPNASNYAIPATGSEYPAKCLSSMIGDKVFDVIVLEFAMRVNASTLALARRLRQRFPDALIINLKVWTPYTVKSRHREQDLREIGTDAGFSETMLHDENFHKYLKDNNIVDLYLGFRDQTLDYTDRLEREVGVHVTSISEIPPEDPLGWLSQESVKFAFDSFHLSKEGHFDAAKRIEEIIERVGVPLEARVNDFETFDHCANWFLTGDMPKNAKHSPSGYFHPLPNNNQKHCLSFEGGRGSIELTNSFDTWKHLAISYMTTGPPPSDYPEVSVSVNQSNATITLPSKPMGNWGSKIVRIPREHYLGKVPPGDVSLFFSTLTESKEPFCLSSYTLTSTNPLNYSFN